MRFERESWRKLYIAESAQHRLLPVFTRGLRDYLLRLAADDGSILTDTDDPVRDLVRLLNAEPSERKHVLAAYEQLLRIQYLSFADRRLWITKFEEAQAARTPGALRQERYKQRHSGVTQSVTQTVTESVTSDGVADAPVTSQRDQIRREEIRSDPPYPPEGSSKKPKRAPAKARIPEPFPLTSDHRLYASSKNWPEWWLENRHEDFVNKAKSKGWVYADWDLAFQGFLRREVDEYGRGPDALGHLAPKDTGRRERIQNLVAESERKRQAELIASSPVAARPDRGVQPLLVGIGGRDG